MAQIYPKKGAPESEQFRNWHHEIVSGTRKKKPVAGGVRGFFREYLNENVWRG